ncbi:MAG: hypothetical protein IT160_21370 [Bryobacterales bacterium]|nr:hypothetical protein [Bryobacterales bacterium]
MTGLVRKIHIWAGLLVLSQLAIYGIAGLTAGVYASRARPNRPRSVRHVSFTPPANATDRQVAGLIYQQLRLPFTRPMPDWFLRHTTDHHLLLDFYNINGIYRVTVLEDEQRLRIEEIRNNLWLFMEDIHAATLADDGAPMPVRLWALWNEVALWSLAGFCLSGAWLWLATSRRHPWAWSALAAGSLAFAILWGTLR